MKKQHRFSIWTKALKKYSRIKSNLEQALNQPEVSRLTNKLRTLEKRILRMHKSWALKLTTIALAGWLASPVIAQDTINVATSPRITTISGVSGLPVSLDFNGDGDMDILIGGYNKSYVIFGDTGGGLLTYDISSINGVNGFVLDESWYPTVVDINNDGKDDVVGKDSEWGNLYVLFGTSDPMADTVHTNAIDSADGFHIIAPSAYTFADNIFALDDINGDGKNDLAVFDYYRSYYTQYSSFVLFGSNNGFDSIVNLENMLPGDGLEFIAPGNYWGESFASGDLNGDGVSDIAIGLFDTERIEVFLGKPSGFSNNTIQWGSSFNGIDGFIIDGDDGGFNGYFGTDICISGDINGDGYDDLFFASKSDVWSAEDSVSTIHCLYGAPIFDSLFHIDSLYGNVGFELTFQSGSSSICHAGDLNGDGLDDIFISSDNFLGYNNVVDSNAYVIYGNCNNFPDNSSVLSVVQSMGGLIIPDAFYSKSYNAGDYNNDGNNDLSFSNASASNIYILSSELDLSSVSAGSNDAVCGGNSFVLSGLTGGSVTSSYWSSSGSGSFNDSSLVSATYTASAADTATGSATLIITGNHPSGSCIALRDSMILTFDPFATVDAGFDDTICEGSSSILAGGFGGAASGSNWVTLGTGGFDDTTLVNATYAPSAADISSGSVTLILTTDDPAGTCTSVMDSMVIAINPAAGVDAGADTTICNNCDYTLIGNIQGGASSSVWTTTGTGSFGDSSLTNATYTPSLSDVASGAVTLTLTTDDPAGPCSEVMDEMILTIDQETGVSTLLGSQGSLYVFPNPSPFGSVINFGKQLNNVKIYSSIGQLVQNHTQTSSISNLARGVYMLVSDEGTAKFIVE